MTTRTGLKVPFSQEKVYRDRSVNQGFPAGSSYKDLKPGQWVLCRWDDVQDDQWSVVISHDERPHNYKGDRSIMVLTLNQSGWSLCSIVQTQIIKFSDDMLTVPAWVREG
jgi:hypothetical protein